MFQSGALDGWQERLERHFAALAASRAGSGFPLFVLEHGLNEGDVKAITHALHQRLRNSLLRPTEHWLVWAVYAAESGYGYDGQEYWLSFEEHMPLWNDRGKPGYLQIFFSRFHKKYNGVVPTGPWAKNFCNICWPITHAILPKYFQRQFAKAMFDVRHDLARASNASPVEIGQLIAKGAWDASKRFHQFLEQEELVGRIALAMLGRQAAQHGSPLNPVTLARLVSDLNKTREAGEWLKEAKRVVGDRSRGLYLPRSSDENATGATSARTPSTSTSLGIRPALLLRRSAANRWSVVLEVPNFEDVARLGPDLSRFLKSTRCTIAGTGGAMLPPGWTLYGPQQRALTSWPGSEAPLLSFEEHNDILDNVLRGEVRLSPGPIWVFRVGSDGIAREVLSRGVRTGQTYVVLHRAPLKATLAYCTEAGMDCSGIFATEILMPDAVQPQDVAELYRAGVQVSKSVRVWPAGGCPPNWDGEGHGDWLSTEEPCFGISHDHPVEEYLLNLDDGSDIRLPGAPANQPVFIRLPQLPPGRHTLAVRPRRVGLSPHGARELEGWIDLNVRDPKPRKVGTSGHAGLVVSIDPPNPSLAELWDGTARLNVLGPEDREVQCSITLSSATGATLINEEIGRIALPIGPQQWSQRLRKFTDEPSRAQKYFEATRGRFTIKGEELGEFVLRLERDATPLRWVCQFVGGSTQIRLFDDTGSESSAKIEFSPIETPGRIQELAIANPVVSFTVTGAGGLYIATQGKQQDILFVSNPPRSGIGISQLLIEPNLVDAAADVPRLLYLADLWRRARVAGRLAEHRRSRIVERLIRQSLVHFCGMPWINIEDRLGSMDDTQSLEQLKSAVDMRPNFAAALQAELRRTTTGNRPSLKWFSDVCERYGVCEDDEACAFALHLVSAPFELGTLYGDRFLSLLEEAKRRPVLVRGARFLAISAARADLANSTFGLPGWRW